MIRFEIDGQTSDLLSTQWDNRTLEPLLITVSLTKTIVIVKAVEQGTIVKVEAEIEDCRLIWEAEAITTGTQKTQYRVDAQTGVLLH